MEKGWKEIDDRFVNTLWARVCKQVRVAKAADIRSVLQSEFVPEYNPFEEYFAALPEWKDGDRDYITELTDTVMLKDEGDRAFFRKYFKKWMVNMVASIMEPSVVNHEILVFIGPQGSYKTTWMNRLMPEELRRYFYVKTDSTRFSKDDILSLSEFALICLEEIDELHTSEMNQLKALVSKPEVNERAAYGHYKERRPHLASFCGTTNNVQFLTDLTGNRRWLPVEVERILDPFTHPVDYEGVYSQAYALYRSGFDFFLSREDIVEVNAHNVNYEVPCAEVELVCQLYEVPADGSTEAVFVTVTHILHTLNQWVKQPISPTKIGIAMKRTGFTSMRHKSKRGYLVIELSGERIRANMRNLARDCE